MVCFILLTWLIANCSACNEYYNVTRDELVIDTSFQHSCKLHFAVARPDVDMLLIEPVLINVPITKNCSRANVRIGANVTCGAFINANGTRYTFDRVNQGVIDFYFRLSNKTAKFAKHSRLRIEVQLRVQAVPVLGARNYAALTSIGLIEDLLAQFTEPIFHQTIRVVGVKNVFNNQGETALNQTVNVHPPKATEHFSTGLTQQETNGTTVDQVLEDESMLNSTLLQMDDSSTLPSEQQQMFEDNMLGGITLDKGKKPKNNYTRSEMINDIKEMKETILLLTRKLEEVKLKNAECGSIRDELSELRVDLGELDQQVISNGEQIVETQHKQPEINEGKTYTEQHDFSNLAEEVELLKTMLIISMMNNQ